MLSGEKKVMQYEHKKKIVTRLRVINCWDRNSSLFHEDLQHCVESQTLIFFIALQSSHTQLDDEH